MLPHTTCSFEKEPIQWFIGKSMIMNLYLQVVDRPTQLICISDIHLSSLRLAARTFVSGVNRH